MHAYTVQFNVAFNYDTIQHVNRRFPEITGEVNLTFLVFVFFAPGE